MKTQSRKDNRENKNWEHRVLPNPIVSIKVFGGIVFLGKNGIQEFVETLFTLKPGETKS